MKTRLSAQNSEDLEDDEKRRASRPPAEAEKMKDEFEEARTFILRAGRFSELPISSNITMKKDIPSYGVLPLVRP